MQSRLVRGCILEFWGGSWSEWRKFGENCDVYPQEKDGVWYEPLTLQERFQSVQT